jgi:hypothetical protein
MNYNMIIRNWSIIWQRNFFLPLPRLGLNEISRACQKNWAATDWHVGNQQFRKQDNLAATAKKAASSCMVMTLNTARWGQ